MPNTPNSYVLEEISTSCLEKSAYLNELLKIPSVKVNLVTVKVNVMTGFTVKQRRVCVKKLTQ